MRESVARYYISLGFLGVRFKHVQDYLESGHCVDDVSLFACTKTLVEWRIPYDSAFRREANRLAKRLITRYTPVRFASGLWLLAKYAGKNELGAFISRNLKYWRRSGWVGRQIAAVTPLLTNKRQKEVESALASNGLLQGLQVIANIKELKSLRHLDKSLKGYLTLAPSDPYNYSLQKTIIAIVMLTGDLIISDKRWLWSKLEKIVADPVLLHKLKQYKP